jgi:hypothetical protein
LASIINASNSGFGGIVSTGDSSGVLQLQAAGTTIATIQSTGLNLGSNGVVFSDSSSQTAAASPYVLKNRIINGDMRIDQRNAGASVSTGSGTYGIYFLDRWGVFGSGGGVFSIQQSSVAPTGFVNSTLITVTTADSSIAAGDYYQFRQAIEGFNIADFGWGTANAQTVTLSFWVLSSLTGTFGLSLRNSNSDRSYITTYTISSANTWEQKTVTIAGDTSGTWLTTNGVGIFLTFSLGVGSSFESTANSWQAGNFVATSGSVDLVGTNGATFYITGVQLEQNTSATPFERRLYNQELANCQRYAEVISLIGNGGTTNPTGFIFEANVSTSAYGNFAFTVQKRATPTITLSGSPVIQQGTGSTSAISSVVAINANGAAQCVGTGFTTGINHIVGTSTASLLASSEL